MRVYNPDIPQRILHLLTPGIWNLVLFHSHFPGKNAMQCYTSVAIYAVPIFVPPGTHCCWIYRGGVDSKLARGFYTWPGIEPQTPWSRVQRHNHSATRSTITARLMHNLLTIFKTFTYKILTRRSPVIHLHARTVTKKKTTTRRWGTFNQ